MARATCCPNPLRIPRPKIDKLACQAQGVGILVKDEITLRDAYCNIFSCLIEIELGGVEQHIKLMSNYCPLNYCTI